MIGRLRTLHTLFILFCFANPLWVNGQPTLPEIAATAENGRVTLSWLCQYNAVRAITVMRSADSLTDYEIIGYVKKLDKGPQEYTDKQPPTGKSYYKLAVIFKSGLTWRSNYTSVNTTKPATEKPAPPKPEKPTSTTPQREFESSYINKKPDTAKATTEASVGISFAPPAETKKPEPPRPKLHMSTDEPADMPIYIKSRYIFTDTVSGHVHMSLPDDVATRSYSVKFFDMQKHLITEVPKINTARIIIDKRNFQRKGSYRFVLRRDYIELESGYLFINPK